MFTCTRHVPYAGFTIYRIAPSHHAILTTWQQGTARGGNATNCAPNISYGGAQNHALLIAACTCCSNVQPCACDSPEGLLPLERVAVYLRKLENGPKLKPLWDSVCELLWRRDFPATTGELLVDRVGRVSDRGNFLTF